MGSATGNRWRTSALGRPRATATSRVDRSVLLASMRRIFPARGAGGQLVLVFAGNASQGSYPMRSSRVRHESASRSPIDGGSITPRNLLPFALATRLCARRCACAAYWTAFSPVAWAGVRRVPHPPISRRRSTRVWRPRGGDRASIARVCRSGPAAESWRVPNATEHCRRVAEGWVHVNPFDSAVPEIEPRVWHAFVVVTPRRGHRESPMRRLPHHCRRRSPDGRTSARSASSCKGCERAGPPTISPIYRRLA